MVEATSSVTPRTVLRVLRQASLLRSLWWTARSGRCVVLGRGSRLLVRRGGRLRIAPGGCLIVGIAHMTPRTLTPALIEVGRGAEFQVEGTVQILGGSRVVVRPGGRLRIGTRTFVNDNATLVCTHQVIIGDDCAIGWNVTVVDSDFHSLTLSGHPDRPISAPVVISDRVWIGIGCTVLKGVRIGRGAVVAAGSLVNHDVPERALAAGSPATVIRQDVDWSLLPR